MKFSTLSAVALSTAVSASTVNLYVSSSSDEINGKGVSAIHEGAAINYFFLGTSPQALEYSNGQLTADYSVYTGVFSVDGGFVSIGASGSAAAVSFASDGTLQVSGSSDGFYACKNTNDPYSYSTSSYELMYYSSDAPSDCLALTLVSEASSSSAASSEAASTTVASAVDVTATATDVSTSFSTVCTACEESTLAVSTYENGAAQAAGAGAALLAGLAYLL